MTLLEVLESLLVHNSNLIEKIIPIVRITEYLTNILEEDLHLHLHHRCHQHRHHKQRLIITILDSKIVHRATTHRIVLQHHIIELVHQLHHVHCDQLLAAGDHKCALKKPIPV